MPRPNCRRKHESNQSSRTPSNQVGCGVCIEGVGKYKCPKCRIPYCSVRCCKEHKLKCPAAQNNRENAIIVGDSKHSLSDKIDTPSHYLPSQALKTESIQNSFPRKRMMDDDSDSEEEGFKISSEMVSRLDNSAWLKKELSDGGLRQLIHEIDSEDLKELSNNQAMQKHKKRRKLSLNAREMALEKSKLLNPKFSKFVDRLLLTAGVLVKGHLIGLDHDDENSERLILAPLQKKVNRITPVQDDLDENNDDDDAA